MRTILNIIFVAVLACTAHAGGYKCSIVGNASGKGLFIAKGRNDGINRLYTSGSYPYEFTWNGTGWAKSPLSEYACNPKSITAGFGRNDGVCRIYTGDMARGNIKEYSFNGSTWDSVIVKAGNWYGIRTVEIGNIKNDDTMRMVAGCDDSTTIAYTYQNGSGTWKKDTVGIKRGIVQDIVIGNGRNDDTNRIYTSGDIFWIEYTYRSKWDTTYHSQMIPTTGSLLASVKNDGLIQLYISEDGGIRDFSWTGAQWLNVDSAAYGRYPFSGEGRNDGKQRLYGLSSSMVVNDSIYSDIRVLEWSYVDSIWVKNVLDTIALNYGVNFDMAAGVVGDARNDGKNRVYALSELGVIYEWEWDDTLNGVAGTPVERYKVENIKLGQNYPNPFINKTKMNFRLTGGGYTKLTLYDILGNKVKTLINSKLDKGFYNVLWDGTDENGKLAPAGFYICSLGVGNTIRNIKILKLK